MINRRRSGFTLLELLISVTLLALITTLVAYSIRIGATAWEGSKRVTESWQQQHLVEQFIVRELSQARPVRTGTEQGARVAFIGDQRQLRFATLLPAHRGIGGIYYVILGVETEDDEAETERLVLTYWLARSDNFEADPAANQKRTVLLEDLREIEIRYFGAERQRDAPEWYDAWPDQVRLPEMVRIRFTSATGRSDLFIPLYLARPFDKAA